MLSPRMSHPAAIAVLGFWAWRWGPSGPTGCATRVGPEMLEVWKTGVLYHLVHVLALLAVAALAARASAGRAPVAGLFVAGVLVFSGSLYVMAITGKRWLGAITPLGGVALLGGWAALAASARGHCPIDRRSSVDQRLHLGLGGRQVAGVVDQVRGQLAASPPAAAGRAGGPAPARGWMPSRAMVRASCCSSLAVTTTRASNSLARPASTSSEAS